MLPAGSPPALRAYFHDHLARMRVSMIVAALSVSRLLEKKFSIRLPSLDIDELHSQLFRHEFLDVVVVAEFHRPSAKPISDVGEIAHAPVFSVLDHIPKHFSERGNFVSHLKPPDVPPFHLSLLEYRSGEIPLLYIEPELGGRVLLNVRGIESDVK